MHGTTQRRTAFRCITGLYHETPRDPEYHYILLDTLTEQVTSRSDKMNYFVYAGLEKQYTRNKWRKYFGFDVGYLHSNSNRDYADRRIALKSGDVVQNIMSVSKIGSNAAQLAVFGGVTWFFSRHWSLGTELGTQVSLEFEHLKIIRSDMVQISSDNTVLDLFFGHMFPSLFISYHFGKNKQEER